MNLPIKVKSKIVQGTKKGRTVGMPTANISFDSVKDCDIEYGVYATRINIDGKIYKAVTNVGLRPSVDESDIPTVETFVIDYNEDLYDKEVELEFVFYIRGTMKFNSLEEVKKQVDKDILVAKENL